MAKICPTVTAYDLSGYKSQIDRVKVFSNRIHIDLMDGVFAPTQSPTIDHIWWPHALKADIHLMYQKPMEVLADLKRLRPRMVIIHNEADVHHMHFAAELHKDGIKAGLALLSDTPIEYAFQIMHSFDHVLVFSGKLGYHGGQADLNLLEKVRKIKDHHPDAEIGWDGGINDNNIKELLSAGVDVLNVGGYIQNSNDPENAYAKLKVIIDNQHA